MTRYDKFCTTTSHGRPRQRCLATTNPPMTCRTASASLAGRGTDFSHKVSLIAMTALSNADTGDSSERVDIGLCKDENSLRALDASANVSQDSIVRHF